MTFVKSLAMVPIRTRDPVGAIGNYRAQWHMPTEHEVELLRALADSTAVAMENVRAYKDPWSLDAAMSELHELRARRFDPDVIEAFETLGADALAPAA